MILNLSIPGQLAAMRTALEGAWPYWKIASLPYGFESDSAPSATDGFAESAAITSATYVDLVSVTGRGIIELALGIVTRSGSNTTGWIRLEIDGEQISERSATATSDSTPWYIYTAGLVDPAKMFQFGSTYGYFGGVLAQLPYLASFKIQAKRSAGGGNVKARYRYLPMDVRT